ncbi:MAG: hypothetical protein ACRC92_13370 [Peptostreptococcaceae bacterium]
MNYSNKTIYNLEYKETKLVEEALSGIEISSSNIVKEVKQIITNTNNENEFINYFLGNNFINNIKDMSGIELKSVYIDIPSKPIIDENGYCKFKVISTSTEGQYTKKIQVSVIIKNPFSNQENQEEQDQQDVHENNINNEIYEMESIELETNTEKIRENIDVNELVIIYDYKEI